MVSTCVIGGVFISTDGAGGRLNPHDDTQKKEQPEEKRDAVEHHQQQVSSIGGPAGGATFCFTLPRSEPPRLLAALSSFLLLDLGPIGAQHVLGYPNDASVCDEAAGGRSLRAPSASCPSRSTMTPSYPRCAMVTDPLTIREA
jgi:hypothetical protein